MTTDRPEHAQSGPAHTAVLHAGAGPDLTIAGFARALRRAGLSVGPGAVVDAIAGVERVGLSSRSDFFWVLHGFFVKRREQEAVFDAVFRRFWSQQSSKYRADDDSGLELADEEPSRPAERRAREALADAPESEREQSSALEQVIQLVASGEQSFRNRDFAQMSAAELAAARQAISRLRLPDDAILTRRLRSAHTGRLDPRRTLRVSLGYGGDLIMPQFRARSTVLPPIVALCDISGSMRGYSRLLLHFLHELAANRRRVHSFVFSTHLSNITRPLATRDPDAALAACGGAVDDWSGGTRIGTAISDFNRHWSRRVLGQGATVLLITDGLERGSVTELGTAMDRLHRSCRRLIWLNPLLGFEGFEAKAAGIVAMVPHVDELRTVHSLAALGDLVDALSARPGVDRRFGGIEDADPRRFMRAA